MTNYPLAVCQAHGHEKTRVAKRSRTVDAESSRSGERSEQADYAYPDSTEPAAPKTRASPPWNRFGTMPEVV